MPTRVLLEGPAIEPLLAEVRQEYGSSVRIISADKVRSGGFGGFFAKQRFELSVEVPDEPAAPGTERSVPATTADGPAQSLEQLLERAEARDLAPGAAGDEAGADRTRRTPRHASGIDADAVPDLGRHAGAPGTATAAGLPPRSGPHSDSGSAFAELLVGLDSANAATAAAAGARDQDARSKSTVRPFRPSVASGSPVNGSAVQPQPPLPSLADLMGGMDLAETVTPAAKHLENASGAPTDNPDATPSRLARSTALAYGLAAPPPAAPIVAPVPGPAPGPAQPGGARPADAVIANLVRVGLPESLAALINTGDTYAGVLTALASRPAAPAVPDAPGEILVLAGDLAHAVPIAREMLEQLGLAQTHLLLAASSSAGTGVHFSRVIAGPADAQRRAAKLHEAEAAWILVLDAPVGATDPGWVRETCKAIGATAVWAVIDATRKTADSARHLSTLGDVEALVVHGVDITADPASVLDLDLPIVSLDGKPARPHDWAARLSALVTANVTPVPAATRRLSRGR